jgi:hypothetical protein
MSMELDTLGQVSMGTSHGRRERRDTHHVRSDTLDAGHAAQGR